ncbi:MAG: hypothetical protein IJH20_02645 [Bacilli bacterium]|nr:hypothetical protein [Bacilli bacterium]
MEEEKKIVEEATEKVETETKKKGTSTKKKEEKIVEETKTEINNETNKKSEEFFEEKKKEKKSFDLFKNKKILFVAAFIIFVFLIIFFVFKNSKKYAEITKVDKILSEQYYTVECLDSKCDSLAAFGGDAAKDVTVTLVKSDGTQVAKYTVKNNAEDKVTRTPVALGNNWFIFKKVDNESKKEIGYSIANKHGEEIYSTEEKLSVINDNLVLMTNPDKGVDGYTILSSTGKVLFSNVNTIDEYCNNSILSVEVKGTKELLDTEGNILITNYYVSKEILDEDGETLYLLVKDSKNNAYNYFSVNDKKIVGDSFQNYVVKDDKSMEVTKKENNKVVKYSVSTDGEQKLIGNETTQSEMVAKLKETVSKEYSIYSSSVYDKDQKYILVDNLQENSFGVYEIASKKYTKLYGYKDGSNSYSSIYELNETDDKNHYYLQVSCSTYSCEKELFYVFDIANGKSEYSLNDDSLYITNYYQYDGGYKVVKYSYSSTNEKYKGKYVLLDKDNKEITVSTNKITVVDKKQLIGNESTSSLVIYLSSDNKVLNDDEHLASKIKVNKKTYYKYISGDKIILIDENGNEVINTNSKNDLMYSDMLITYIDGKTVHMMNGKNGNESTYKLGDNEKMNDASGDLIPPYRGALFINNSQDKRVKVIGSTGKTIKTMDNVEIEKLYYTSDKNVVIITKKFSDNKTLYGAYLAK